MVAELMNTATKPVVLVVDDDEEIRTQLKWALCQSFDVCFAEDRPSAVEAFKTHQPQVVLLDLGMPPMPAGPEEGLAALAEILALNSNAKVIVLSGQSERANALQAIDEGAYDFLVKPPEIDVLQVVVKRAVELTKLKQESKEILNKLNEESFLLQFNGMLGSSPQMQAVFEAIRKVASSQAPVLLLGESGTGKEMAARAIHRNSSRPTGPFVAINCGAIPEALLESELFGHEKGAFTGAHIQRLGKIESASGGTLFLDEIGDLPLPLQVKLLRFLQEQKIERLGGRKEIEVNVRVVAATNADLKRALAEGTFREDLYYRVAVVAVRIPPLRERPSDVLFLANYFLQRFATENAKGLLKFSPSANKALEQHGWQGNVRELENRVRRGVIMVEGETVRPPDLELGTSPTHVPGRGLREAREELERQMIEDALRRHEGKIAPAALELGISRPTFYELLERLGIKRPSA